MLKTTETVVALETNVEALLTLAGVLTTWFRGVVLLPGVRDGVVTTAVALVVTPAAEALVVALLVVTVVGVLPSWMLTGDVAETACVLLTSLLVLTP